jgi:3-oxoacyl-[acyl-carrier-protein] synthase III
MATTSKVIGTGSFLPPTAQDNFELYGLESIRRAFDVERARGSLREMEGVESLSPEEVFDTWARQVTGIAERRVVRDGDGHTTETMSAEAAKRAMEAAGVGPGDIDAILVGTVTPSDSVPNASVTVGSLIGAPQAGGFALNGACTGFLHAVASAHAFIRSGMARTVLAVAGDALTRITSYSDPTTAVLFSDGASAAVLTASEEPGVLGPPFLTANYAREHLYIRGQGWEDTEEPDPEAPHGGRAEGAAPRHPGHGGRGEPGARLRRGGVGLGGPGGSAPGQPPHHERAGEAARAPEGAGHPHHRALRKLLGGHRGRGAGRGAPGDAR